MALEQKLVPLNFAGGLDKKTDPFQVSPGSFLTLTNAEFERPGAVNKRNGFRRLGRRIAGTTTNIEDGKGLATRNSELIAFESNDAYSYSSASEQWTDKGNVSSVYTTVAVVDNNASEQDYDFNGATHSSGLQCYAFVRNTAASVRELYISIVDTVSGQIIRPATMVLQNGWHPKVIAYRNSFLIYAVTRTTGILHVARLAVNTPLADVTFTELTGNAADTDSLQNSVNVQTYDVITVDSPTGGEDAIYIVFNNRTAAGGTSLWWYDNSSVVAPNTKVSITSVAAQKCTVIYDAFRDGPAIAYYDGTTLRYRLYSATLVTVRSFGTVVAVANISSITGVSLSDTFIDLRWYYTVTGTPPTTYVAQTTDTMATISFVMGIPWSQGSTTVSILANSVWLASKAWVYEGRPYVATNYLGSSVALLQATYFVVDGETGRVVVRALPGTGIFALTFNLPEVSAVTTTTFRFAVGQITGLAGDTSVAAAKIGSTVPIGVSSMTLDFADPQRSYRTAEAAGALHLGGGLLQMYDGIGFVEHGFNLYPEGGETNGGLTVSGLSAGSTYSYQYIGVYEWTDNAGNLHRSFPSVATTATSSAVISAGNDAAITFPTLGLTQKTEANGRAPIMLALYRTEDAAAASGGTVFYRLPYTTTNFNDTSVTSVTITDAVEDADLIAGAPLYTATGVANVTSPPPLALVTHKNRLFVVDSTNPLVISYSKQIYTGIPVEFGLDFVVNVTPQDGPVTALASMDDKLIVFKRNSIYFVSGDGPSENGENDDLSSPTFVTSDCGCINQRSIGTTPDGLIFQSDKGIKLLTRALAVVDIGAAVTDLSTAGCTSAVQIADRDQIRLTFDDRTALTFDYFVGQWSQFTNVNAVDSLVWNQEHVYLRASGIALIEDPDTHTDDGSFIQRKIKTAWFSFAGLQGYQRVYRILLLGKYLSPHTLYVDVAYDFNPTPVQTIEITPTAATTYGSTSPYGGDSVYGGVFAPYQWRVNIARQKCQSIQLTIRDVEADDPGASSTLSGMSVLVGVIGKTNRMPSTQSAG